MVQHITELTRILLECEYASVVLVEPEGERLRLVSMAGASREQEQNWFTVVEKLFLHEMVDAASLSRLRKGEVLQEVQAQPLLQITNTTNIVAPICAHEQFLGMLILHLIPEKHTYPMQDKKAVAGVVGTFIASVIERERLTNEQVAAHANALSLDTIDQQVSIF